MAFPEKTLQSEVVYDGPIFRIRKDKVTVGAERPPIGTFWSTTVGR